MADRARFWGRVGGIFHTDEMPAYGVTVEEVEGLRRGVKASERDAVVFVADKPENASDALKAVMERAREALRGVPEETRTANPDGTSRYMRPRPGASRMYPETDIPPIQITEAYVEELRAGLPELPEQKLKRLIEEQKLNEKVAKQIADSEYYEVFEAVVEESGVSATVVAVFLTESLKSLRRDGVQVEKVSEGQMRELFRSLGAGELTKEALADVFVWLSKNEGKSVQQALEGLGLKIMSGEELEKYVDKVIGENRKLIQERGEAGFGVLMGLLMKDLRGKVDASVVSSLLREKLRKA
jgi:glutamyl-tRNA(Gln) amidotransferase subunit E